MSITLPAIGNAGRSSADKDTTWTRRGALEFVFTTRTLDRRESTVGLVLKTRTVVVSVASFGLVNTHVVQPTFELVSGADNAWAVLFVVVVRAIVITITNKGLINAPSVLTQAFELGNRITSTSRAVGLVRCVAAVVVTIATPALGYA